MSSSKSSENNENNEKNITKKENNSNSKENIEENKEKDKIFPQMIDIKNSQKSNQSLSNVLDEKEIYNIPISIEKSNSNSNNNSKSDEKSENQENNQSSNININPINPKEENNINNKNDVKLDEINNNINNESDSEMHPTEGPIGMSSAAKDPEEYRHLRSIVSAFFNYQIDSLREVSRMERDFKSIGEKYTKRLSFNYTERIEKLKHAIWQNYSFLLKIADPYKNMFKLFKASSGEILMEPLIVEVKDIIKMRSTLKLFIRDWAIDGIEERNSTYKPILNELQLFFKDRPKKDFEEGINVLVPGAGLGRLMYEIAKLGFKSQGNEFSYYMLLCSNYIFNNTTKKDEFMIQPLIHSFSNIKNEEIPFKKIMIPDENLAEELSKTDTGEMSMVAGEFCRVYKDKINFFDSIVTCYFIDTANNVIEYIETIHNIIKIGGLWINFGPLLYHYTDNPNEVSIELSWEEIKKIIIDFGFEFKKEEEIKTTYSSNKDSMMQRIYKCIFFTAIKRK
jgi:carnosine N-methyltransferase